MRWSRFSNPFDRRRFLLALGAMAPVVVGGGALGSHVVGCVDSGVDRGLILESIVSLVAIPTYEAAAKAATALWEQTKAFRDAAPGSAGLLATQTAWRAARDAWKPQDAFAIGPSADLSITAGSIDSDVNAASIDALAADGPEPTATWVASLGADVRGFLAIEQLLFDPMLTETELLAKFQDPDFGPRRAAFMAALAEDLAIKIGAVRDAWTPEGGDFGAELAGAGKDSATYPRLKNGVDAMVNALIAAAEILTAVRLAKPLGLDLMPQVVQPDLVEAKRSDNSVGDLASVIAGISSVYLGPSDRPETALFFTDAVRQVSPTADDHMRDALTAATDAVNAISGPLRLALVDHLDQVTAAHAAVRQVKLTLQVDVANALGTSVGFNVTDGD